MPLVCKRKITVTKKASEWRSWNRIFNDSYKTFNLSDKIYENLFCLKGLFGPLNFEGVRTNGEKKIKKKTFFSVWKRIFSEKKNY